MCMFSVSSIRKQVRSLKKSLPHTTWHTAPGRHDQFILFMYSILFYLQDSPKAQCRAYQGNLC